MYNISKEKYFNTWSAKSPAIFEFLPARFQCCIGAYSHSTGTYTEFPFEPEHVRLMRHDRYGRYCSLQLEHQGTKLLLEFFKPDSWTLRVRVRRVANGEWGLRFWTLISLGFPEEGTASFCGDRRALFKHRSYDIAAAFTSHTASRCLPVDSSYMGRHFEQNGYYGPLENDANPRWFSCAFNFEEMEEVTFSVAVANDRRLALKKADEVLALSEEQLEDIRGCLADAPRMDGPFSSSVQAIRDVMEWNTVADYKNRRVVTSQTRAWIDRKFGGWYVWGNDVLIHSLLHAWGGDWQMAQNNLLAVMSNIVPANNIAALMSEYTEWVDRSQIPMLGFLVLKYYEITHDIALIDKLFDSLCGEYQWWFDNRDGNKNGVMELGSSVGGHAHFRHTKMAAKDESGMDNSPMYDSAEFLPETHTMNMEDISLNSLLCLEGESLAIMAEALGKEEKARELRADNARLRALVDEILWDEANEIYANRHWDKGFVSPGPTSFYSLVAGIPDEAKAKRLAKHILAEDEFWTFAPMPSIWLKDPIINEQMYFRGRMWPSMNYFTYMGLKRYGLDDAAHKLAKRCVEVFSKSWENEGACYENFDPFTGEGKSTDSDPYYGWGALMPLMWVNDFFDCDPWNGVHFGSISGESVTLENIRLFDGSYTLICGDKTELKRNGKTILETDAKGRFRHFRYEQHFAQVDIPAQDAATEICFPGINPIRVTIDGKDVPVSDCVDLPLHQSARVAIWH